MSELLLPFLFGASLQAVAGSPRQSATPWLPESSATGGSIRLISSAGGGVLYASNGLNLLLSIDRGLTWSLPDSGRASCPVAMMARGNLLYAYLVGRGFSYSTNGGNSFESVPWANEIGYHASVWLDSTSDKAMIAIGTQELGDSGVDTAYALYMTNQFEDPESWFPLAVINDPSSQRRLQEVYFEDGLYIITTTKDAWPGEGLGKIFYSLDGYSWQNILLSNTGEINDLAVSHVQTQSGPKPFVLLATQRGLVVFSDFPTSWRLLPGEPLRLAVPYRVAADSVYALVVPLLKPEVWKVKIVWDQDPNGITIDTLEVRTLPDEPLTLLVDSQTVFMGTAGLGFFVGDTGLNFSPSNRGLYAWGTEPMGWSGGPWGVWPKNLWVEGSVAYAVDAEGKVYKTSDYGMNWEVLPLRPAGKGLSVAACPSDPNEVYAIALGFDGSTPRCVWRSSDGGASWELVGPDLRAFPFAIARVAVSPADPRELWGVLVDTGGVGHPAVSQDGGETWELIPEVQVDSVFDVCVTPQARVYWATNDGVWLGRPGSWRRVVPDSQDLLYTAIFYNPANGWVYTASSSGGLYALEGDSSMRVSWGSGMSVISGAADSAGRIILLGYLYYAPPWSVTPVVNLSSDLGNTWESESVEVWASTVGLFQNGKALLGSFGGGLWGKDWGVKPLELTVRATPEDAEIGQSVLVELKGNKPLDSARCSFFFKGDTLPVSLRRVDDLTYSGSLSTSGLSEGTGVLWGWGRSIDGQEDKDVDTVHLYRSPGQMDTLVYPWPNPAQNSLNFNLYSETEGTATVLLVNVEGRPVAQGSTPLSPGENKTLTLDLSRVSPGLYVWKVVLESEGRQRVLSGKVAVRK